MDGENCHVCVEQYTKKTKENSWKKGPPKWLTQEPVETTEEPEEDPEEEDGDEDEEMTEEILGIPVDQLKILEYAIQTLKGVDKVQPMVEALPAFLATNKPAPSLEQKGN